MKIDAIDDNAVIGDGGMSVWYAWQAQISNNLAYSVNESCFVNGVEIDAIDDNTAIRDNPGTQDRLL